MKRKDLKNDVKIIGELVKREVRRSNAGTADETIALELTVRTAETEEHVVSFFAFKYGKGEDGKRKMDSVSKLFEGYETIATKYNTIEDSEDGNGEKIEIKGSLTKNMYIGKDNQLKEFPKIKGTFCSRITDMSKYTPCAVWSAHMHITRLEEDVKDATGEYARVIGMVLGYNVEDEFEFRIYKEKVKKGFLKVFDEGDSCNLKGNIVNRPDEAIVAQEDEEDSWGEEMEVSADASTIMRRYFEIITGDRKAMDTDDEEHPLSVEKVAEYKKNIAKRKMQVHENHQAKQEANRAPINPNVGVEDDLEDIPF